MKVGEGSDGWIGGVSSALIAAGLTMILVIIFSATRPAAKDQLKPVTVTAYAPTVAPAAPSRISTAPLPPPAWD